MSTIRANPIPVLVEHSLVGLGARIAVARRARALTQADLARLSDVGTSTVASLEAGYHGVSVGNFLKVLNALDLLTQVDNWLAPSMDPAVVSFATRKLGGRGGG
jgi:transcriptional regulator with XRE-family HTH domain